MSNFDVLARKFGYQKQRPLKAFYSAQDIIIYLSMCLSCLYLCVPVAIYYFGFPVLIDTPVFPQLFITFSTMRYLYSHVSKLNCDEICKLKF